MSTAPLRVLLVEDQAGSAGEISRLLQSAGYEVQVADCCLARSIFAQGQRFNIVICDIQRTHCQQCEILHETLLERNGQAIAITEQGLEADVKRAKAAGFKGHIARPFVLDSLLELLEELT